MHLTFIIPYIKHSFEYVLHKHVAQPRSLEG